MGHYFRVNWRYRVATYTMYGVDMQPLLDVGMFRPLKTHCHIQSVGFAPFEILAPIQKQNFILVYEKASGKVVSIEDINVGLRAAGIYPTNADRPIDALMASQKLPEAPKIPPMVPIDKDYLYSTLQDRKQV